MMTSGEKLQYKGPIDCFVNIVKKEGVVSLYRGCVINIVRGFAGGLTLVFFDVFKDNYVKWKNDSNN